MSTIFSAYKAAFMGATDRIKLCNWLIASEGACTSELVNELSASRWKKEIDVDIRILTGLRRDMIHPDDDAERGSIRDHFETIERFGNDGIALRCHPDYHAKFCVADNAGIVSSANLLENSLNGELGAGDPKVHTNYELGCILTDELAVRSMEYLFDAMWHVALYNYGITAEGYHVRPESVRHLDGATASPQGNENLKISWTLCLDGAEDRYLKDEIVRLIRAAKRDVLLSSMTYKPVEPIHGLLKKIARAGKSVVLLVRESSAKHATSLPDLQSAGVVVRLVPYSHAKFLVVDGKEASVFTANIEEKGLERGAEVGITFDDVKMVDEVLEFAGAMTGD